MMCKYLCVCVCVCVLYVCVSSVFQAQGIRKQKYVRQCSAVHLFYMPIVEESDCHLLSPSFFSFPLTLFVLRNSHSNAHWSSCRCEVCDFVALVPARGYHAVHAGDCGRPAHAGAVMDTEYGHKIRTQNTGTKHRRKTQTHMHKDTETDPHAPPCPHLMRASVRRSLLWTPSSVV